MNIMNIGGTHDNGEPRLRIGLSKNNGFDIEYDTGLQAVIFKTAETGEILNVVTESTLSPFKFIGAYTNITAMQSDLQTGIITPNGGDIYMIKEAGGVDTFNTPITANCRVVFAADGQSFYVYPHN